MSKIVTLDQLVNQAQRTAFNLDKKVNTSDMLSKAELELICSRHASGINHGCGIVTNKYGLSLRMATDNYACLGDDWTVEFFVKLNTALSSYPQDSAMHFAIVDSNGNGMALALSKSSLSNGYPCENFFIGNISTPDSAVYFDSLNVSIADGARHHVCIEHSSARVVVYIDGALVVANNFGIEISDFTSLVFGADAFIDSPCLENLAVFDRIRLLGECRYLPDGSNISETIAVPAGAFEISESTLLIYQNGLLEIFIEDEDTSA